MKNIESFYPVTPLQQGMIFHSLLDPDSGAYVVQLDLTIEGSLNIEAFEQAWQILVDRHAIFRTRFIGGKIKEYVQVVLKDVKISADVHDLTYMSFSKQKAYIADFKKEDRKKGFDMESAPLMRLTIFKLEEDVFQFLWTFHHVLLDGWSTPLVFGEVFAAYEMICSGKKVELPPVKSYRDYIVWLKKQDMSKAEAYWREALQGFYEPTPLTFEGDEHRNHSKYKYDIIELLLDKETTKKVQEVARQHRITVNTILQGAWSVLLSRYSGKEDILFGATVSGRPADLPGVESVVGLFINTLPVRVQIQPDQPVISWLQKLQKQQTEIRQYEYTPLVDIQSWSEVKKGMPLFESILVFENYPIPRSAGEKDIGFRIVDVQSEEQTNYPLTLVVAISDQLILKMDYDQSKYQPETIQRILRQLQTLIEGICENPTQRLDQLTLVDERERYKLLVEWNQTAQSYPRDLCLHQEFENQVNKTPEAVALEYRDRKLTYAELDQKANQVAHYLQKQGIGPEMLVGICVNRSPEMIIGLLGVLKAGAAYVPIDPAHPKERIAFMLRDTEAKVILTEQKLLPSLPEMEIEKVCLDGDLFITEPVDRVTSNVTSENLAYVIYTSGSTGQPKGVMVEHRSVINLTRALKKEFGVNETSRVLQLTSFSFDVSVGEILTALLSGATLLIEDSQTLLPGPGLLRLLQERRVTTVLTVPSVLSALPEGELPDLKALATGGEPCSRDLVARYGKDRRFFNCYGPTEATVITTMAQCTDENESPSIGRPLPNVKLYVLDKTLQPVPIGMPGELYIGGECLARGYWKQPELTAEHFIDNPFGVKGERIYKTGDLVRYRPDGNLEFIDRLDEQVKIRGFRIELGEIETVLRKHPAVREAVVIAREDQEGEKRLAAYLTAKGEEKPELEELTRLLKDHLPSYMIPSGYMWLEAIPLTINGKIDREALPIPDWASVSQEYVAPRNLMEEIVANVWSEVLSVEKIGIYDNFFERGGHSLLATQAVSRLQESLGIEVELRLLFEYPTVAELSEQLELLQRQEEDHKSDPILPVSREQELPTTYFQQRMWFYDQLLDQVSLYNIPNSFHIKGNLDISILQKSIQMIIERHESLRTNFNLVDGRLVQVIHESIEWKMEVIDYRALPAEEKEAEIKRLAVEEMVKPFDLAQDPLIRATLIQVEEQEYVFLFTWHHIIADGWSVGVLLNELFTFYNALQSGEEIDLPELTIQYVDYAAWQREWLKGEDADKQLHYWRERLKGYTPLLQLPTDRPRPAVRSFQGEKISVLFSVDLLEKLHKVSRKEGSTLFMTLLSAFKVLLYRYSGQEDILVGTLVAGRSKRETEKLIGCFINTLILRSDLSGEPTFKELLQRVRETTLGAYAHQKIPFERLIEELQVEQNLSHSPLFQTMFLLQNIPVPSEAISDLQITPYDPGQGRGLAEFDLYITMAESTQGLWTTFEYNTDLFDHATIQKMIDDYRSILEQVVTSVTEPITSFLPLQEPQVNRENQVNIRGYWIEQKEVEAAIRQFSGVKDVYVMAEEMAGENHLVAYIVHREQQEHIIPELKSFLAALIPSYMIPSHFVLLDELPHQTDGKVDLSLLPQPEQDPKEQATATTWVEKMLFTQWSKILDQKSISIHDNFFDLGGDSFKAVQLMIHLQEELQVEIPLQTIFEAPTISSLARKIQGIIPHDHEEIVLDPSIHIVDQASFRAAFLTEATSFLGAFLLRDLLKMTQVDVYCLVSEKTVDEGLEQIKQTLIRYELWDDAYVSRIFPIMGSLSQPLMGLSEIAFAGLASKVDVIYHTGVFSNASDTSNSLKESNVVGLQDILRLATQSKIKPVHFISTVSVFDHEDGEQGKIYTEEDMPEKNLSIIGSADRIRMRTAEQVIHLARKRGIPISLYRCGRIIGDSQTGASEMESWIGKLITGCITIGKAPRELNHLEGLPVDYISRGIIHLSMTADVDDNYHFYNPNGLDFESLVTSMEQLGIKIERVPREEWIEMLRQEEKDGKHSFVELLDELVSEEKNVVVSGKKTEILLTKSSITPNEMDMHFFSKMLQYLIRTKQLKIPTL